MSCNDIGEIARLLAERIEDLGLELLGEPTSRARDEWRCRSRGSLCVHVAGPRRGRFSDYEAGEGGDSIDLIAAVLGVDTREAMQWARAWLGVWTVPAASTNPPIRPRARSDDRRGQDRSRSARDIWRKALPAEGTATERHLRHRSISIAIPASIRHALALKHGPTGLTFQTMVAAITVYPSKRVVAIQKTFLQPDGRGKANVMQPRMSLGPVAGGAVRLAPAGPRLGLCEGIEDGLAVMQAEPGLPVWACLGTSGLRGVILAPLPLAAEIVILADADEAGEAAAQDVAHRFIAEGRRVSIARPRGAKDFNDLLRTAA